MTANKSSLRTPPFVGVDILKKLGKCTPDQRHKLVLKTRSLSTVILPSMVGVTFLLYNGKDYNTKLNVKAEFIGYRLGEFVATRKMVKHPDLKGVKRGEK